MLKARKFVENLYYHEFSKGLIRLGNQIENNIRDFEIKHPSAKPSTSSLAASGNGVFGIANFIFRIAASGGELDPK